MKQADINKEWNRTFDSNLGKIGMLVQPRHVTPGLRKPYEYVLPMAEINELTRRLRTATSFYRELLQQETVWSKSLAYGRRISLFILGYRPFFVAGFKGITAPEWDELASVLYAELVVYLPEAKPYIDEWNEHRKFQMRFECYIAAKELING